MNTIIQTVYDSYKDAIFHPDTHDVDGIKVFYRKINNCNRNIDVYILLIEYTKQLVEQIKFNKDFNQTKKKIDIMVHKLHRTEFKYKSGLIRDILNDGLDERKMYNDLKDFKF